MRADAYSNLGGAYRKIRDYEHARQSFAAALQFDPNKTMALVGMGLLEQRDGDFAQAIGHYSHAMAVEPTAVGYLLLAKALEKAGHGWEARAAYDKASQLTDDLEQAQRTAEELQAF